MTIKIFMVLILSIYNGGRRGGSEAVTPSFPIILAKKKQNNFKKEKRHMSKSPPQCKHVTKERENECGKVGGLKVQKVGLVVGT